MDITPNEERRCNLFSCYEGKERWRSQLRSCLITLNNANENRKAITRGELLKLNMEEREKSNKEYCIREFKSIKEFFPTEEEYCRYFKCDAGKENPKDIINSCMERMENFLK